MKLTDSIIKAAKPKDSAYSLSDGQGLGLYIQPTGAKWWRYRHRHAGKANMCYLSAFILMSRWRLPDGINTNA
jgi:hypothetical protein